MARRHRWWSSTPEHEVDMRWWRVMLMLGVVAFGLWNLLRRDVEGSADFFRLWAVMGVVFGVLFLTHRSATRRTRMLAGVLLLTAAVMLGLISWFGDEEPLRLAFLPFLCGYLLLTHLARKSLRPRPAVDPEVFS